MVIFQPDRALLASFVRNNAHRLSGHLLDVGGADGKRYKTFFGHTTQYTILDPLENNHPDILAKAESMPLKNASVDGVLCVEVLMYVSDAKQAISEIARALKPNGTLLLTVSFMSPVIVGVHDFWRFTNEGLNELLSPHFKDIVIERRGGYHTERAQQWIRHRIWKHDLYNRPILGRMFSFVSSLRGRYASWRDARDAFPSAQNFTLGYNVIAIRSA